VPAFILLFPNSLLGPECASIFVIFTSQVWNMVLSFYQSVRTVPSDLKDAATMFHLSAWQRFWRVEVPFGLPGLLWNTMLSMSASWFFVVASEAISVSNNEISLPGIGSYIALAISHADMHAIGYAILTMFLVILTYDQLLFRPITAWSEKFKTERNHDEKESRPWIIALFQRTHLIRYSSHFFEMIADKLVNVKFFQQTRTKSLKPITQNSLLRRSVLATWYFCLTGGILFGLYTSIAFIFTNVDVSELGHVVFLGLITGSKITVLILLSTIIWVPVGVWIGLHPNITRIAQPIIQFLAAFPANLLFPVFVILIVRYRLNQEIWTAPLLILGTQWYILFNVIAGANALPKSLIQASRNLHVKGWLWWRRLILPGIFPYLITGIITAAGGAWNASIIAEAVSWGSIHLHATGLGEYITQFTHDGNFPKIALGISVMCLLLLIINRLLWQPLYNLAQQRFQID
jgi:NitT/TauT family transport system permease protein